MLGGFFTQIISEQALLKSYFGQVTLLYIQCDFTLAYSNMSLSLFRSVIAVSVVSLLVGASSCSVYVPLQPSASLLRNKGESEVAANLYLSGRLEGSVAYSPAKHVLVRVAGGLQPNNEDSVNFHIRQFELGGGTYRSLSDRWLIGAMSGYGRGQSSRRFTKNGFEYFGPDPIIRYDYSARFHRLYGEAFVAYEGEWATVGAAYRLSQVRNLLTSEGEKVAITWV